MRLLALSSATRLDAAHRWAGAGAALLAGMCAHPRLSDAPLACLLPWSVELVLASALLQLRRRRCARCCARWAVSPRAPTLMTCALTTRCCARCPAGC
jgi:hypothetical protein